MRSWLGRSALIAATLVTLACSGKHELTPAARRLGYCRDLTPELIAAAGEPTEPVTPLTEQAIDGSACNAVERSYPPTLPSHVTVCTDVEYATNPPSSGPHYPIYPEFRVYADAIPVGFWVHSLEHGGVVFTYSCSDCADEVSQAAKLVAETQPAPACCSAAGCPSTATNQLLLTPDPGLSTRWAASSWGFTLTADCFEPAIFQAFASAQRDNGSPETICENSYATDVTRPGPE